MRRTRSGLTLVELLAVLAILAALAAVLYPAVAVQIRKGQSVALADQLKNLNEAISNYRSNVLHYPRTLTQLTQAPANGAPDICTGGTISGGNANAWRGPYIAQNIVGDMPVGDATIANTLQRNPNPPGATTFGLLQIIVTDVDQTSATDLEQQFDATPANFATGTILWVAAGSSGTLTFQVPIRGC